MDESSFEDSSFTVVKGDSRIAFAYIKEVKSKKRRFFVLKAVPKASPYDTDGLKSPLLDYFLYAYKSKKHFERGDAKRIYDLTNVILLSRCTKKANKTVLGVCFQEDALFLKFESEDELNRWYFHLNEIYTSTRNCSWPELRHCFSVTLKNKDLAATNSKHGKADLPGQYRFCLTDSTVLLVKDDLLNPELVLPFPCIRSCIHSKTSNFFQLSIGRLSPLGEGILHFEAEQNSLLKELIDTLLARLSEGSSRDLDSVKSRKSHRHSKDTNSFTRDDISQRPASMHYSMQRSACVSASSSGVGSHAAASEAKAACQLCDSACKCEDYCYMGLAGGHAAVHNRSQNSSMSLSTSNSEFASPDPMHCAAGNSRTTAAAAAAAVAVNSATAAAASGGATDDESRLARVTTWRSENIGADAGHDGPLSIGARANSIGSRPVGRSGSYLSSSPSYHCGQNAGHRDNRQVFVEVSFQRPRTTSDASRHFFSSSVRSFRPRARSHGNRFGMTSAHRNGILLLLLMMPGGCEAAPAANDELKEVGGSDAQFSLSAEQLRQLSDIFAGVGGGGGDGGDGDGDPLERLHGVLPSAKRKFYPLRGKRYFYPLRG